MSKTNPGIVGRLVMAKVKRGEKSDDEVCEVVACQICSTGGYYRLLIATHDGYLLEHDTAKVKLVAPAISEGPYR